ncbi:MAG: L,D-transpeptidase family protein [Actinomycetes bacterium]
MGRARAVRWAGAAAALAASLVVGLPGVPVAQGQGRPPYHPSRLTHLGDAQQVLVATSRGWSSSFARLRSYERAGDGTWRQVRGPVTARIGRNGFVAADRRRQGSSTTPAGTFGIPRAFGIWADPGTALPYREVDATDWWPYDPRDPSTYNVWQTRRTAGSDWRPGWAEDLSSYGRQYRHAAVLDYNLPSGVHRSGGERVARQPADTRRGGGIFLHIDRPGATTGCVSVAQADMRAVLRWLDPSRDPVVVMGPRSAITRM